MRNKPRLLELILTLLIFIFLVWAFIPIVNCESKAVRGLFRIECIEVYRC